MYTFLASFLAGAGTLYLIQDVTKKNQKRPHFNVLATRNRASLSRETNDIIDLITVDPETFPVGSFRYRAHRYPGDIDIFEKVRACCTEETAKKKIVRDIQKIALKIANARKKGVFLGDFKAGIDERFKIDIGDVDNGVVKGYDGFQVRRKIRNLYDEDLLSDSEYRKLMDLAPKIDTEEVNDTRKNVGDVGDIGDVGDVGDVENVGDDHNESITVGEWENLNNELRKYYIVRWDLDELIDGVKVLKGDKILLLGDALTSNSIVKLDIWAPIKGRYNEITNFFLLILQNSDGTEAVLNANLGDRIKQLDKDIHKYSSPEHRNSLKLAKRLWNKALTTKDEKLYDTLYPLFDSDAAMLNQIGSEAEVIQNMLEGLPIEEIPIKTLIKQIDGFKERIMNTLEIQFNTKPFFKIINSIINYYENNHDDWDPNVIVHYLNEFNNKLRVPIENYSANFLRKNGINI